MNNEKSNRPELFIDNEKFDWDKDTITGAELRELGSLPADVEIYWKAPGNPDLPIENDTTAYSGPS